MTLQFQCYIGVDYSGAGAPDSPQKGIQVALARGSEKPSLVRNPNRANGRWTRRDVAKWLEDQLQPGACTIVGMDFSFALPLDRMDDSSSWDGFARAFRDRWCTGERQIRKAEIEAAYPGCTRLLRLTEQWTSSAKSVFNCKGPGVALATFAGIPWLLYLREKLGPALHLWPVDGFGVPPGKCVLAEVYPSLLHNRYPREDRNGDEHDAYSVAAWLQQSDSRGILSRYFRPPLTAEEKRRARAEGWILGVC